MAERPEDLNLPSAVVCRIVKDALPPNTKVTKEAQAMCIGGKGSMTFRKHSLPVNSV